MASFVLVPGAMHGAGHFEGLLPLLRSNGRNEAVAVELPGLSEDQPDPLRATLEAHVSAVVAAVDSSSKPVILFGHSTAGRTVAAAAEQRAARIQKLIFLAADTLPGPFSFALEPPAEWVVEGLLEFKSGGHLMGIADGKTERVGEILFSGAGEEERRAAALLLRPSPLLSEAAFERVVLDRYWHLPKAYIKCTHDRAMLPVHQDAMYSRLREGAFKFELESGHGPFVSCPDRLAATMLEIAEIPALQFRPMRQLCEGAWEDREELGVRIEVLGHGAGTAGAEPAAAVAREAAGARAAAPEQPPPKRPHVPQQDADGGRCVAYRVSKSRRDSTLVKVLKFPAGVALGAPACYWYESFVDDPAQYTNSSLNVPERGHEAPLDMAGISRSLCAEGVVTYAECSRVAFSWQRVVTKVPGDSWTKSQETEQVWGIDGREWNGSFTNAETGAFVENLAKYTKGSAEAFWEDVPRKATNLLATMEG